MNTQVLVVEDDLEINELIGEYLGLENIKYLQATTGQAGIHQAVESHPDAVILDLMLPDTDGFEVARTLATRRATFDIPIVILSCMCQECDRLKGYSAGALYYMNKPFLPDDLISTLQAAFAWKAGLKTRIPAGTVVLGEQDVTLCPRALNEMVADIFTRTDLPDATVGQIRQAIETLGQWALRWNQERHKQTPMRLDYKVLAAGGNGNGNAAGTVEWKLSEQGDGMLTEAFFKPPSASQTVGGGGGGGLMGWGGSNVPAKPILPVTPPATWLQLLAQTGAVRFEKDSVARTVRFTRQGPTALNGQAVLGGTSVPVVEIDGTRYPTRLRDEAIAAKRK